MASIRGWRITRAGMIFIAVIIGLALLAFTVLYVAQQRGEQARQDEAAEIARIANPTETILVADSLTGQDAVRTAKAFHERLPLTGLILTRADGTRLGFTDHDRDLVVGQPQVAGFATHEHVELLSVEVTLPIRICSVKPADKLTLRVHQLFAIQPLVQRVGIRLLAAAAFHPAQMFIQMGTYHLD